VPLRWTPPEVFKPLILSALERAGGTLEADELFEELEALAKDQLRPADREITPEGEPRWQYAARRARVALINEGLMTRSRPGVWDLPGSS
jgi:nucleotide-binding universal stress UspA family protein